MFDTKNREKTHWRKVTISCKKDMNSLIKKDTSLTQLVNNYYFNGGGREEISNSFNNFKIKEKIVKKIVIRIKDNKKSIVLITSKSI